MPNRTYRIAVIPGDGTGPEVVREGLKVLAAVAQKAGVKYDLQHYDLGGERYQKTGDILPDSVLDELRGFDAIYLGAIGHPDVAPGILEKGLLLRLRFELDQYINLRPVKLYPGVDCPLKDKGPADIDFVVVRENTEGQLVDVSMLDCQIAILENAFVRYFVTGETPRPLGTRHPLTTPFQAFPAKDGWIVVALSWGVENQWELFCATIGRTDLIDDPRFDTPGLRTRNHDILEPMLNEALRRKTAGEWLGEFDAIGLPCGPLNDIPHAAAQPQVQARGMLVDVPHPAGFSLRVPDTPVKLSRTPGGIGGPPPALGEHTDAVLSGLLGLSAQEIAALREAGAVFGPLPSPVSHILEREQAADSS